MATMYAMAVVYKVAVLLVGLAFAYMGYRLFMADKIAPAGSLTTSGAGYSLGLDKAAPGIFFSLFGSALICVSLVKGLDYDASTQIQHSVPATPQDGTVDLPDSPPGNGDL